MNLINKTLFFTKWIDSLKDKVSKMKIIDRIEQAEYGNFGDYKSVGDGVYEMRIHSGKGYRVYYAQEGKLVYLLLCGGDKTTQQNDVKRAKKLWQEMKTEGIKYV